MFFCVVTTIQVPTASMKVLAERVTGSGGRLIVIGDAKGPPVFELENTVLFALEQQRSLPFQLATRAPIGHYSRKNLGFLVAIAEGATVIYETDDDNAPNDEWRRRSEIVSDAFITTAADDHWCNVYRWFGATDIWPRGYPLDRARRGPGVIARPVGSPVYAPIQQGLANRSPDVDAVWRLLFDRDISFAQNASLAVSPGTWCPFNSQSTWWYPEAFVLMYLPSYCSFRMTDIWRSFVAQRCLWELHHPIVFHSAEVVQDRNCHRLLDDFRDEITGYLHNEAIAAGLSALQLEPGPDALGRNLMSCYEYLVQVGHIGREELALIACWLDDCSSLRRVRRV